MPRVTSTLSRNCCERLGMDSTPQSAPARSPAKKLSPASWTPASWTAVTKASTSASPGTGWSGQGHQNSTVPNPAALAAAGRSRSGTSVKSIEQFARYGSEGDVIVDLRAFRYAKIEFCITEVVCRAARPVVNPRRAVPGSAEAGDPDPRGVGGRRPLAQDGGLDEPVGTVGRVEHLAGVL